MESPTCGKTALIDQKREIKSNLHTGCSGYSGCARVLYVGGGGAVPDSKMFSSSKAARRIVLAF